MKRSEINALIRDASSCFLRHGWSLPPTPRWDVTDFGLGNWREHGLVLVNLAEEPEYCEKLMYARSGMVTPAHKHFRKKEDIVCRSGELSISVWAIAGSVSGEVILKLDGVSETIRPGAPIRLSAGRRITLTPGTVHEFVPVSEECVIGEVSTANDDATDNWFVNPRVGRFPGIEEDEAPIVRLVSDS